MSSASRTRPDAVALRKIRDRRDERRPRRPQFLPRIGLGVLADDCAGRLAPGFLKRANRAERARIVGRAHQHVARFRHADVAPHFFERRLELPVAVERDHPHGVAEMERLLETRDDALCCARRRALPRARARGSGPRRPVRSSTCARTSPDSGRRAGRPGSCWRRSRWRPDAGMSIAISGIPASRYFDAMAGATASSVWNSMTRSTFSLIRCCAFRSATFG